MSSALRRDQLLGRACKVEHVESSALHDQCVRTVFPVRRYVVHGSKGNLTDGFRRTYVIAFR